MQAKIGRSGLPGLWCFSEPWIDGGSAWDEWSLRYVLSSSFWFNSRSIFLNGFLFIFCRCVRLLTWLPFFCHIQVCPLQQNSFLCRLSWLSSWNPFLKHSWTNLDINDTISLLDFVLSNNYFIYNGDTYKQIQGRAMGSPVSAIVAIYANLWHWRTCHPQRHSQTQKIEMICWR